jgi:hypothetical protein
MKPFRERWSYPTSLKESVLLIAYFLVFLLSLWIVWLYFYSPPNIYPRPLNIGWLVNTGYFFVALVISLKYWGKSPLYSGGVFIALGIVVGRFWDVFPFQWVRIFAGFLCALGCLINMKHIVSTPTRRPVSSPSRK